jgi:hypothetical protein
LKDEPTFKQDKSTVSWHADSTLEHFSTIGVYHVTSSAQDPCALDSTPVNKKRSAPSEGTGNSAEIDKSWRIAMRVHLDAEGPNLGKPASRAAEMKNLDPARVAVPPVLFALPSQSAYFMLDDFNHHHHHSGECLLALAVPSIVWAIVCVI